MKKNARYTEVLGELEVLVERMNRGEITIDDLGESVKNAARMIRFLKERLRSTEGEVEKILRELEDQGENALTADE